MLPSRKSLALALCIAWVATVAVALTPSTDPDPFDAIRDHAAATREALGTPGAAAVVVDRDRARLLEGFGARDLASGDPVTPDTRFLLGSATKAFTATALGVLIDEGALAWDRPVVDDLPGFRMADDHATLHATLRDFLSHRSGLARHPWVFYRSTASRRSIVDSLRHLEAGADLRQSFQYSNLGYVVAGEVGARAIDGSWEDLVRSRLLEPLGMERTGFAGDPAAPVDDTADTVAYRPADEGPEPIEWPEVRAVSAAGGLVTSARDLVPWLRLQLSDGTLDGRRILDADTLAEIQAPQAILYGRALPDIREIPFALYGLGWNVGVYRGHRLLWHAGATDGFGAMVGVLPDDGYALAVLANESHSDLPAIVLFEAVDRLLDLESIGWAERLTTPTRRRSREATEPAPLPRDVGAYVGTFAHPAYGEVAIAEKDDALHLEIRGLDATLVHRGDERFALTGERALGGLWARFGVNVEGEIDRLEIPFAPGVAPIVFLRRE